MLQIHQKIESERVKAGLTQDEMAERLQIKRSTYQYWEKSTPSIDKIKAVARALGLPEDHFFGNNDEKYVPHETKGTSFAIPALVNAAAADLNLYERLIEEKERGRLRAEKQADEYMQIIKDNLTALLLNSAKNQELLIKIWDEQTTDDLVMMNNQDVDSGKPAGTSAEISGNLQKALVTERKKVPQKSETGKRERAGK